MSYDGDPDCIRFVYEELQKAATIGAYDEALRRFIKAGMLLKGKKIDDFTAMKHGCVSRLECGCGCGCGTRQFLKKVGAGAAGLGD